MKECLQHYTLIPITFDPGGCQLGPLATSFLWGTRPPDISILPMPHTFNDRLSTSLSSSPYPQQAAELAYNTTHNFGLFRLADKGWKQAHLHEWFTPSYTAMLPSQWAQHILGQNLLVATARHLQTGLNKSHNLKSNFPHHGLQVAGQHPTRTHPILPLPSEYFYHQTVVRPTDE